MSTHRFIEERLLPRALERMRWMPHSTDKGATLGARLAQSIFYLQHHLGLTAREARVIDFRIRLSDKEGFIVAWRLGGEGAWEEIESREKS